MIHCCKLSASLYGIVFILLGVMGFIPLFFSGNLLFGFFQVSLITNIIHLLTGLIALFVMFVQPYFTRLFFQLIGFIYAAFAVLGFIYGSSAVFGFIDHNAYLTWLHVIASVVALILGFGTNNKLDREHS